MGIDVPKIDLIVAPAENVPGHNAAFGVAAIFDVLEHAPAFRTLFGSVFRMIKRGGVVITATAPLFHPRVGHHLGTVLSGDVDWVHRRPNFTDIRRSLARKKRAGLDALNNATASHIGASAVAAGFRVVSKNITYGEADLSSRVRGLIDLPPDIQRGH